MDIKAIEQSFRERLGAEIKLVSEGRGRYRVSTPFQFDDGDHLIIVLKREGDRWVLTDEGHTYMHLTYSTDEASLYRGTRQETITSTLTAFSVEDRDGELMVTIHDNEFGDALHRFVKALLKISDLTLVSRDRAE